VQAGQNLFVIDNMNKKYNNKIVTKRKNKLAPLSTFMLFSFGAFCCARLANAAGWSLPANPGNLIDDFDQAILNLTNWLLGLAAMAGVLAMIWGGINYIGSSGDTQKADLSKRIIYYALMGIFVAGIAYALINVVVRMILV